jgi:hypothetical protein
MMATVVIFYALCWFPFHVITLVGDHDHTIYDQKFMPSVWIFSHWLAMSNSCYNPMIYIWLSNSLLFIIVIYALRILCDIINLPSGEIRRDYCETFSSSSYIC